MPLKPVTSLHADIDIRFALRQVIASLRVADKLTRPYRYPGVPSQAQKLTSLEARVADKLTRPYRYPGVPSQA